MSLVKLAIVLVVVVVVAVAAFGAYVFAVIAGPLQAEAQPPSAGEVAKAQVVEHRIGQEVAGNAAFLLQLTDEDLTALLRARAGGAAPVRDLSAVISSRNLAITGSLNGTVPVPFSAAIGVGLERGTVQIAVERVSVGAAPLPGAVREELQPLIDQVVNVNQILSSAGATQIQRVDLKAGLLTISGIQAGGKVVSDAVAAAMNAALAEAGSRPAPTPPGANIVPAGRIANGPGNELYLALGDSLAANEGAPSGREGYVSRFHSYLETATGRSLGLMNLGVSGESTFSIFSSQLPQAIAEMDRRRNDGDPSTRVAVLTLDLGANDLLGHLGSAACQQDIRGTVCTERLDSAITAFSANITEIMTVLSERLEPGAGFYVMTIYNPFDFGLGIPFERDSNDIITLMNEIIRAQADRVGAKVADAYTPMGGNAAAWTHMLNADIHPNAAGYQALAYAFAQAHGE